MMFSKFAFMFGHKCLEGITQPLLTLGELWMQLIGADNCSSLLSDIEARDSDALSKNLDEWEIKVIHNKEAFDSYRDFVGEIFGSLYRNVNDRAYTDEVSREMNELLNEILYLFYYMEPPVSLRMLILYHSRIRHLLLLSELYSEKADKQVLTWRHLFEKGCECIGIYEEREYARVFFPRDLHLSFYHQPLSTDVSLCFQLIHKNYWGWSLIDWETSKTAQHTMRSELYAGLMYADLAYRKHTQTSNPAVRLHPYKINYAQLGFKNICGRFQLQGNMNGYIGYRGTNNPTIVLAFSGTEFFSKNNWTTNLTQYFGHLDPVYLQAVGLLHSIRLGKSHKHHFGHAPIEVYGHSLGGGLMQFAVACNRDDNVCGYGYNSAGIDVSNADYFHFGKIPKIWHLYRKHDYVFKIIGTLQLGKSVASIGMDPKLVTAHFISSIRQSAGKYQVGVAELVSK